jgi:hypothetical protein
VQYYYYCGRYNPSLAAAVEEVLGPRSLSNNPLAALYSFLLRPTPATTALIASVSASPSASVRTVGVLLRSPAAAARAAGGSDSDGVADDSDGVAELLAADGEDSDGVVDVAAALAPCVALSGASAANTAAADAAARLVLVVPTFSGGAAGPSGIAVASPQAATSTASAECVGCGCGCGCVGGGVCVYPGNVAVRDSVARACVLGSE